MIDYNEKEKRYYLTINGTKLLGTSTNDHTWCFRKNMFNFDSDQYKSDVKLYDVVKNYPIIDLPSRIEFVFFQVEDRDELDYPLNRLPYPFNTFTFIKEDNTYFLGISCFLEEDKWKTKWASNIYFEEIKKIVKRDTSILVVNHPVANIKDDDFEFFLELEVENVNTIEEAFEIALPTYFELIEKVELQLSDVGSLLKIIETWNENKNNANEEYWQSFFSKYSHIISQAFSIPTYIFNDKAYLGGKSIDNSSGKLIDFVYRTNNTNNLNLIEIKTPQTKLVGNKYRGTYALSNELTGSINQLLQYKDSLTKEYYSLKAKSKDDFEIFNSKCLLIIGNTSMLNDLELESFELFRNEFKSIEIITFNELFGKIEIIMELIRTIH